MLVQKVMIPSQSLHCTGSTLPPTYLHLVRGTEHQDPSFCTSLQQTPRKKERKEALSVESLFLLLSSREGKGIKHDIVGYQLPWKIN